MSSNVSYQPNPFGGPPLLVDTDYASQRAKNPWHTAVIPNPNNPPPPPPNNPPPPPNRPIRGGKSRRSKRKSKRPKSRSRRR